MKYRIFTLLLILLVIFSFNVSALAYTESTEEFNVKSLFPDWKPPDYVFNVRETDGGPNYKTYTELYYPIDYYKAIKNLGHVQYNATLISPVKNFGNISIEFYKDYRDGGKIYWDLPRMVTKTVKTGDTYKVIFHFYTIIDMGEEGSPELTSLDTGDYLIIEGLHRLAGEVDGFYYACGPVKITFGGKYYNIRTVKRYDDIDGMDYGLDNGKISYMSSDDYTSVYGNYFEYARDVATHDYRTYTLTINDTGLFDITHEAYGVWEGHFNHVGNSIMLYIADSEEELKHIPLTETMAKPSIKHVEVDGKKFECPIYKINNDDYVRIRDIGYMLKGTKSQFDVSDYLTENSVVGKDYVSIIDGNYNNDRVYEPIGNELSKLSYTDVKAAPLDIRVDGEMFDLYPRAYEINDEVFVNMKQFLDRLDIDVDYLGDSIKINAGGEYEPLKLYTCGEYVNMLFKMFAGREPDKEEYDDWTFKLRTLSIKSSYAVRKFVFETNYEWDKVSNEKYLTDLYLIMFDREPDEEGRKYWLSQLESGLGRKDLFNILINTEEFKNNSWRYGMMP